MNSDNTMLAGRTLDYGPYGWVEAFDPAYQPFTRSVYTIHILYYTYTIHMYTMHILYIYYAYTIHIYCVFYTYYTLYIYNL